MSENQPIVVNNYSIDVQNLISDIRKQEQIRILNMFIANQVVFMTNEPGQYLAVSYPNADKRDDKGHKPDIKLLPVSFGIPAPQAADEAPVASE
jgi:hypothetical protein